MIAGSAKGRRREVPPGDAVRPTSDRVKEAVFSALDARNAIGETSVLDLWAGSGSLAIEALSRGAERALLVERDAAAEASIRSNLDACGMAGRARVTRVDVARFVDGAPPPEAPFDLVLADPPYGDDPGTLSSVLLALGAPAWVEPGGLVVVERRAREMPEIPEPWRVAWERAFGDTLVLFLTA